MQDNTPIIQQLFSIKAGTMLAGLAGALIRLFRKTQGSLQARVAGFVTAVITVLYVLPFFIWFFEWKFALTLDKAAEHLLAFALGMVAQTLTENFIDDPAGSLYKWVGGVKKFKRVVWNGENVNPPIEPVKSLTESSSEDTKQ